MLESALNEKKITETNFCSVEREAVSDFGIKLPTHKKHVDGEEEEIHDIDLFFIESNLDGKRMLTDNGAPLSFVGKPWLEKHLEINDDDAFSLQFIKIMKLGTVMTNIHA